MREREREKRRLRKGWVRMLEEIEQAVRDIQWFNDNRIGPGETPIDCEWEIVQAAGVRKVIASIDRDDGKIDTSGLQTKIEDQP